MVLEKLKFLKESSDKSNILDKSEVDVLPLSTNFLITDEIFNLYCDDDGNLKERDYNNNILQNNRTMTEFNKSCFYTLFNNTERDLLKRRFNYPESDDLLTNIRSVLDYIAQPDNHNAFEYFIRIHNSLNTLETFDHYLNNEKQELRITKKPTIRLDTTEILSTFDRKIDNQ